MTLQDSYSRGNRPTRSLQLDAAFVEHPEPQVPKSARISENALESLSASEQRAVSQAELLLIRQVKVLSVGKDTFESWKFDNTELQVHASRTRSVAPEQGLPWFEVGTPPGKDSVAGDILYGNNLRWRLTRMFLQFQS